MLAAVCKELFRVIERNYGGNNPTSSCPSFPREIRMELFCRCATRPSSVPPNECLSSLQDMESWTAPPVAATDDANQDTAVEKDKEETTVVPTDTVVPSNIAATADKDDNDNNDDPNVSLETKPAATVKEESKPDEEANQDEANQDKAVVKDEEAKPEATSTSHPTSWTTEHHLVDQAVDTAWGDPYRGDSYSGKALAFMPGQDRQPAVWRTIVHGTNNVDHAIDVVASDWSNNEPTDAGLLLLPHKYANVLLERIVTDWLPSLVRVAAWEATQHALLHSLRNHSPMPPAERPTHTRLGVELQPSQLVSRIQQGCTLAWTAYRRNQDDFSLWPVQHGGRVALYLQEHLFGKVDEPPVVSEDDDDDEDLIRNNPYLPCTNAHLGEWLGLKTAHYLQVADLEEVLDMGKMSCVADDIPVHWPLWKTAGVTDDFQHATWGLECTCRKDTPLQKSMWALTIGWSRRVVQSRQNRGTGPSYSQWRSTTGYATCPDYTVTDDLPATLAQGNNAAAVVAAEIPAELLQDTTTTTTRRSRRNNDGIFYGHSSNMTPKQVMDAVLRACSTAPQTAVSLAQLVPDESTDPWRRLRTALGRLVYKKRQLCVQAPVVVRAAVPDIANQDLYQYLQHLQATETKLRQLVLDALVSVPTALLATAADERQGSMEAADAEHEVAEWRTDHALVGQRIFRPSHAYSKDGLGNCVWCTIQDYSPAVESNEIVESTDDIGLAREPTLVERRMRFRVVTADGSTLVLTEAQVEAGLQAARQEEQDTVQHPLAGKARQVTLVRDDEQPLAGHIVGTNVADDGTMQILVLPDTAAAHGFWAPLRYNDQGALECTVNDKVYAVQQFEYHASSTAYQACETVLTFLKRHAKAGPFLHPVDAIALNIPTYHTVVQHPMDLGTVAENLGSGKYGNVPPNGRTSAVSRMLNGPFRADIELIFDNAVLFNQPDDWIHQAAVSLKATALRKIESLSKDAEQKASGRSRPKYLSMYVDDDSDVEMYQYESDDDEEFVTSSSRRKRGRHDKRPIKEDSSARVVERPLKLNKLMNEQMGLRGNFANLPLDADTSSFAMPPHWTCRVPQGDDDKKHPAQQSSENDLEQLLALHVAVEAEAEQVGSYASRRSTRTAVVAPSQPTGMATAVDVLPDVAVEFTTPLLDGVPPRSRHQVEMACEGLHEQYARMFFEEWQQRPEPLQALYKNGAFPPYLGHVVNGRWQIRNALPVLQWILKGLIASGHVSDLRSSPEEEMMLLVHQAYYIDASIEPFAVINLREVTRRKKAEAEEKQAAEEEDVELSEYEQRRLERVKKNEERLKALGF